MHLRIGDRVVDVEMVNGIPTIKADAEEIRHPDGRIDVIVHVPCFSLGATKERTAIEGN
jgi:hypothetical protein